MTAKPALLYYVHAHGAGHLATFRLLYPALSRAFQVIALTTHHSASQALQDFTGLTTIQLPAKWPVNATPPEHTFSKAFEETPYAAQPAERVAALLQAVQRYRPVAFYCDGSPELAIVARGMGVPVVLVHLPGNVSADPTQVFAYALADHIVAHFPQQLEAANYAHPTKTYYSGFLSRYAVQTTVLSQNGDQPISILLGWDNVDEAVLQRMTADSGRRFDIIGNKQTYKLGPHCHQLGRVHDIASAINSSVVITAAGQNSLAELISLNKRLVILPEVRPYGEQQAAAEALARHGLALLAEPGYSAADWAASLAQAEQLAPDYHGLVNPDGPTDISQRLEAWYA